ncbi:hypothetical protein KR009_012235 [Drosophila setifemur]|nr:hypothetical protein KR009_012235 [Drosophila setifemur]
MVIIPGALLFIFLATAQAALPARLEQLHLAEESPLPALKDYRRLMELRSLGMEFVRQFENISATDVDLLEGRLDQQDLVCLADMAQFMKDLTSAKLWALAMIDSWGSIPSGYLYGNRMDLGNYEECLRIDRTTGESHQIKGKYCLMDLPVAKWLGFNADFLSVLDMRTAVCLPSSCSAELMETFVRQLLQRLLGVSDPSSWFSIQESSCKVKDSEPFGTGAIVTIVLLSVFCGLAILCTLYDYLLCPQPDRLPPLVKVFSVRANSRSLFAVVDNKATPNVIHCVHGIRCMSLIWVILGHEYTVALILQSVNAWDKLGWMQQPFTSLILYSPFAVDSFLFISGMLLVVIGLRALERSKGRLNVPLMYLHRYLRLTPIVGVAILVYTQLLGHLAKGPLAVEEGLFDYSVCSTNWYLTLLYVQNYVPTDLCLPHTWYLAVDMQLYILSPLLLIVLYKWGKKAAGGVLVLMLLLSGCLFATIMTNDYKVLFINGGQLPDVQRKLYFATHTHAAPWLVGALFGYFLHRIRDTRIRINQLGVWAGWLLCLAVMFTSIFAMLPYAKLLGPSPTVLEGALFYTLTRIGWPLALCWVVFACMQGYGGLANGFLSSPLWQPLSRLSYSAYIWHIFIQEVNHRRVRSNPYFSDYDVMLSFWGALGFTVLMSYVLYVIVEAPLGGLEGLLLPSKRSPPKPAAATEEQANQEVVQEKEESEELDNTRETQAEPQQADPEMGTSKSLEGSGN